MSVSSVQFSSGHPPPALQLPSLFQRLQVSPRGGLCVQVGCSDLEVTLALTRLFDHLLALDTSSAALDAARAGVVREGATNVDFELVQESHLEGVADEIADAVVECEFLKRLQRREQLYSQLAEFARVLRHRRHAYITVPLRSRRLTGRPLRRHSPIAVSERQLAQALSRAGLIVYASDESASPRELLLHLERE